MPVLRRRNRRVDGDEVAGWIAMTDVFSLFAVVAIGVGAAQIAELNHRHANLPGDWTSIVTQNVELLQRVNELKEELAKLKLEHQSLQKEKERLDGALKTAAVALEAEKATSGRLRAEVMALEQRLEKLKNVSARIDAFELELADCKREKQRLSTENATLSMKVGTLEAEISALRIELSAQGNRIKELSKAMLELKVKLDAITGERDLLKKENKRLSDLIKSNGVGEAELRRQLLGLEGDLKRVVFVLDRSGSMDAKDPRAGVNRWDDAISTIDAWLRYLAVDEAALIVFSSGVEVFPPDGKWVSISQTGPAPLLAGLADLKPSGATNTLAALKRAYGYPGLDTVILFTDGAPDSGRDGGVGTSADILQFATAQREAGSKVRIHVVGIGDYFSGSMRDFLLRLSGENGGTFIGR